MLVACADRDRCYNLTIKDFLFTACVLGFGFVYSRFLSDKEHVSLHVCVCLTIVLVCVCVHDSV